MKSLSELQSSPDVGPLERVANICVAGKLVDEYDRVSAELVEAQTEIKDLREQADRRRDGGGPPQRSGQRSRLPELEEKADALAVQADELRERVLENSVAVRMRADDGRWRQWQVAHPARDEQVGEGDARRYVDAAGYAEDSLWARGLCNIAALVADLQQWVTSYNGEPTSDQWWTFVRGSGAPGDLVKAASTLVGMHVNAVDPGKSRRAWRADRRIVTDSE